MKVKSVKLYTLFISSALVLILSYTVVGIHIFLEMSRMIKFVRKIDNIKVNDTQLSYISDQLRQGVPHSSTEQEKWIATLSQYNDSLQNLFSLSDEFSDSEPIYETIMEFQTVWNSVYAQMVSIEPEFRFLNWVPKEEVLSIYVEREKNTLSRDKLYNLAQLDYRLQSYNIFIKKLLRNYMNFLDDELHREIALRRKHLFIEALVLIPLISIVIAILFFLLIRNEKKAITVNERISDMQRMQEIGRATGQISHDLKNMLAGISGFAELSKEEPNISPEIQEYLEGIQSITQRAGGLCKTIENISKQVNNSFEEINLHSLFLEFKELFPVILPKRINCSVKVPDRSILIIGNDLHLFQVIMNLAINASHAIENNGTISISSFQNSRDVTIVVSDTGAGIPREHLPHIFESGYSTKGNKGGSGYGLYIVNSIIEEHNGTIHVESTPGKGTVFTIVLPLAVSES